MAMTQTTIPYDNVGDMAYFGLHNPFRTNDEKAPRNQSPPDQSARQAGSMALSAADHEPLAHSDHAPMPYGDLRQHPSHHEVRPLEKAYKLIGVITAIEDNLQDIT